MNQLIHKFVILSLCVMSSTLPLAAQASVLKDSHPYPIVKLWPNTLSSSFSVSYVSQSGKEYCEQVLKTEKNCFPFQNTSKTSQVNIQFDNAGILNIDTNFIDAISLMNYTPSTHVIASNPETHSLIYTGLVNDMVGLTCDGAKCKPWN
ncbi:hypothetical protein [Parashewanella tropica]|uniref:hypothetical protein n=1 Tax=Parashewanella tropica TaxID=2547970 RepID=UPI001059BFEF|nr:hypothetical protein [Parashewanella tropica]